jgi:4-amino-4-deoxy-L-arabinose transferase-like glycosyltransferase
MILLSESGHAAVYLVSLAAVMCTSLSIVRLLGIQGIVRTLMSVAVLNCAQIVGVIEILSLAHAITWGWLLACHCASAIILCIWGAPPFPIISQNNWKGVLKRFADVLDAPLKILLCAAVLAGTVTFFLALAVPPNNYDGLTYHMARVGYYFQNHSLDSFPTANIRQTVFPANAEILILWQVVLLHGDRTAALVQWLSWCGSMLGIYGLARLLKFSPRNSLFAAIAFGSLPQIILQSTSTQNDLVSAFFLLCLFYFVGSVAGVKKPVAALVMAGIAFGLALGTKSTTILLLPGLALFLLASFLDERTWSWRRIIHLGVLCIAGFLAFGALFYIQDLRHYGSPTGPAPLRDLVSLPDFQWNVAWSNLGRSVIQFLNPAGSIPPCKVCLRFANWVYPKIGETAFHYLKINKSLPGSDYFASSWSYGLQVHEDVSAFGLLFGILGLPLIFISVVRRWRGSRTAQRNALAVAAIASLFLLAVVFRWQHWHMRLLVVMVASASPLLAGLYTDGRRISSSILNMVLVIACLIPFVVCTVANPSKPLYGMSSIWGKDRISLMCMNLPSAEPMIRIVDRLPLNGLSMGIVPSNPDVLEYPLFGDSFQRRIVPIRIDRPNFSDLRKLPRVDCLLISSEAQEYFLTGRSQANLWFGRTDLHPLLEALRRKGSGWRPLLDIDGFTHFFVREGLTSQLSFEGARPDLITTESVWYSDQWVQNRFKVGVRMDPTRPTLQIRGEMPALGVAPILSISSDDIHLSRLEMDNPGPFSRSISLSSLAAKNAGSYAILEFTCNLQFNPSKLGQSGDSRDLSWRLMDLKLSAEAPPPPRASPVDYRILDGWWTDQWVGDKLKLNVRQDPRQTMLVIRGFVPTEITNQELQIFLEGRAFEKRELVPGAFNWEVSLNRFVPKHTGDYIDLTISSTKSFNPKRIGQSEDSRNLCWRLSAMELVPSAGLSK